MEALQRFKQDLNLCFSIFKGIFAASALFQRAAAAVFRENRGKIFHKVMGAGLLVFTNQVQRPFCIQKGAENGGVLYERRKHIAEEKISARSRTEAPAQGAGRKAAGKRSAPRQLERETALLR